MRQKHNIMHISEFSKYLREQSLYVFNIDGWSVIQRDKFDIQIEEHPYNSIQIFVNLKSDRYSIRVWGKIVRSGKVDTAEDLKDLCTYFFSHCAACVGYIGLYPGEGMNLNEVTHPFPRWVSESCKILHDQEHANQMVGICSGCSDGKFSIIEELPRCNAKVRDPKDFKGTGVERDEISKNDTDMCQSTKGSHESEQMPNIDCKEDNKIPGTDEGNKYVSKRTKMKFLHNNETKREIEDIMTRVLGRKNEPTSCKICGKEQKSSYLESHMKRVHGAYAERKPGCSKAYFAL